MGRRKIDEDSLHTKAIRLLEGGAVSVMGLAVRIGYCEIPSEACMYCNMDCLCVMDNEMCQLCSECDSISGKSCILILCNKH